MWKGVWYRFLALALGAQRDEIVAPLQLTLSRKKRTTQETLVLVLVRGILVRISNDLTLMGSLVHSEGNELLNRNDLRRERDAVRAHEISVALCDRAKVGMRYTARGFISD